MVQTKKCECCRGKNKPGVCTICKGTGKVKIIHSRNKGNSFERKTAKRLSEWTGSVISRTPSSGGWAKTGDITPKDPKMMITFPFCIELKNRESWDLTDLICNTNVKSGILSWWEQCLSDSKRADKVPLLIFTKNLHPEYCMMQISDAIEAFIDTKHAFYFDQFLIFLLDELLKIDFNIVCKRLEQPTQEDEIED